MSEAEQESRLRAQAPELRNVAEEYRRRNATLTVNSVPPWVQSGDPVFVKKGRTVIRSMTQTESRWGQLFRRIRKALDDRSKAS